MTDFADKLLAASRDNSLSPDELRQWMRRAVLRLRKDAPADALDHIDLINEARAKAGEPLIDVDEILADWATEHGFRPETNEPAEYLGHWSETKEKAHDPDTEKGSG